MGNEIKEKKRRKKGKRIRKKGKKRGKKIWTKAPATEGIVCKNGPLADNSTKHSITIRLFLFASHSLGEIAEQGRIGASFSLDSKLGWGGGMGGPGFLIV